MKLWVSDDEWCICECMKSNFSLMKIHIWMQDDLIFVYLKNACLNAWHFYFFWKCMLECMTFFYFERIWLFFKRINSESFFFVSFSKPKVSMQSLNLLAMNFDFDFFFFCKRYLQILMANTKSVNVINYNILMHMCQNGWMNKNMGNNIKLQIGNGMENGYNFILNLSCSLRAEHECNGIDPVLKYEKLGSKGWLMNIWWWLGGCNSYKKTALNTQRVTQF